MAPPKAAVTGRAAQQEKLHSGRGPQQLLLTLLSLPPSGTRRDKRGAGREGGKLDGRCAMLAKTLAPTAHVRERALGGLGLRAPLQSVSSDFLSSGFPSPPSPANDGVCDAGSVIPASPSGGAGAGPSTCISALLEPFHFRLPLHSMLLGTCQAASSHLRAPPALSALRLRFPRGTDLSLAPTRRPRQ